MPSLNIRHVTTYRYRRPVSFGEHRMMFRPRNSHDQKVIWANLEINPDPSSLRFFQDAFGNHVGIARFSSCAKELQFESTVRIEHLASDVFNLGVEDLPRPFPSPMLPTNFRTLHTASNVRSPTWRTRSANGLVNSCPRARQFNLLSFW